MRPMIDNPSHIGFSPTKEEVEKVNRLCKQLGVTRTQLFKDLLALVEVETAEKIMTVTTSRLVIKND